MSQDWTAIVAELEQRLKLRSIVFAMQLYERRAEMEAIARIRRPQHVHTLDQVVGLGAAKTDDWYSGRHMTGVWFATIPLKNSTPSQLVGGSG